MESPRRRRVAADVGGRNRARAPFRYNLCYSTILSREDAERLFPGREGDAWQAGPECVDGVHHFVTAKTRRGILPRILEDLLAARKRAKADMKKATDPMEKAVQNGRQLALKISANSVYGFTGAAVGQLPCLPIASTVTAYGRTLLLRTKSFVESTYPRPRRSLERAFSPSASSPGATAARPVAADQLRVPRRGGAATPPPRTSRVPYRGGAATPPPRTSAATHHPLRYTIANGYAADAEVVYGDTDSVMVNFGFGDVAATLPKAEVVAAEVTKIFPPPVKLEFEKVDRPSGIDARRPFAAAFKTTPPAMPTPQKSSDGGLRLFEFGRARRSTSRTSS